MTREEYINLCEKIDYHMNRYYNEDSPEISDYEYDNLMLQVKAAEKEHPDWITKESPTQKIGGTAKRESGVTVTHNVPMLSIQDVFTKEDVISWVREVRSVYPDANFSVEQKIDGLSMSLRYTDGKLTMAETRGDGLVGEDVTLNALVIPDVLKTIELPGYVELRGEVYMSHEDFERFNDKQESLGKKIAANPRNLAAGTLRQLDSMVTKERGLRMYVFNVQDAHDGAEDLMVSHVEGLEKLAALGVPVVWHKLCTTEQDILDMIDYIGENRGELAHDIDGAVVKIDQIEYREAFAGSSKYSAGHIAYKYPPEEKEVEIEEIEVAVGRTGKMTFRARFKEAVRLCGTNVLRATLHNADFIESMNIAEGCKAICRKQGEIIPAIVRVTVPADKPYSPPEVCPVCSHALTREDETCDIYCTNPSCPAQLVRTVAYFAGKDAMDIKNFGETYVETLVEQGYLKDYADIFLLKDYRDELVEKGIMGKDKNTDKILEAIEEAKNNDAYKLLTGLAIRNVGKTTAKGIMKHYGTIDDLMNASVEELETIDDVGHVTAACIADFFKDPENVAIINKLREEGVNFATIKEEGTSDKLKGLTIVVTGTLPTLGRKEVAELIEKNGGKNTGSISKKTDLLVAGEAAGSKLTKAQELGVKIISEAELLEMLE